MPRPPATPNNSLALILLVTGKILGIVGLVLGASPTYRTIGGVFLVFDALFIVASIVLCIRTMGARARQDADQKAVLAQMVREGTLKQFLQEIEAEEKTTTA